MYRALHVRHSDKHRLSPFSREFSGLGSHGLEIGIFMLPLVSVMNSLITVFSSSLQRPFREQLGWGGAWAGRNPWIR